LTVVNDRVEIREGVLLKEERISCMLLVKEK